MDYNEPSRFVATLRLAFVDPDAPQARAYAVTCAATLSPPADYPGTVREVRVEAVEAGDDRAAADHFPTFDRLGLLAALLDEAAEYDRPLEALSLLVEDLLDAGRTRFCPTPQARVAWSEEEGTWWSNRSADLLERDLRDYPQHRYRVDLYLDRPGEDSDHLETLEIAAPTRMSATNAALALSAFVLGARATRIEEEP